MSVASLYFIVQNRYRTHIGFSFELEFVIYILHTPLDDFAKEKQEHREERRSVRELRQLALSFWQLSPDYILDEETSRCRTNTWLKLRSTCTMDCFVEFVPCDEFISVLSYSVVLSLSWESDYPSICLGISIFFIYSIKNIYVHA